MAENKNHLSTFLKKEPEDLEQHGIKGMKWGIRRSRSELAVGSASPKTDIVKSKGGGSSGSTSTSTTHSPGTKAITGEESSAERYTRLKAQAKAGKGNSLSDQDLKFVNSRTEALAKVNKLNQNNKSWLAETSKSVIQTAAQKQMQTVANAVADKYISGPLIKKLGENAEAIKETAEVVKKATK